VSSHGQGLPDLTQPPPNHPAYRGASPQAPGRAGGGRSPIDEGRRRAETDVSKLRLESKAVPGPAPAPQILAGNLLPTVFASTSSQESVGTTYPLARNHMSMASVATSGSGLMSLSTASLSERQETQKRLSRAEGDYTTVPSLPGAKSPLLTPADLLQSSSAGPVFPPTVSTNTSFSLDKVHLLVM